MTQPLTLLDKLFALVSEKKWIAGKTIPTIILGVPFILFAVTLCVFVISARYA